MNSFRVPIWATLYLWMLLCGFSVSVYAGNEVPVPADIRVTLTANPSEHLIPGEPIQAVLTVTNLGPDPVQNLIIQSASFVNEYDITAFDCQDFLLVVQDQGNGGYSYVVIWFAVGQLFSQTTQLDVGQSLTCNMTFVLTRAASLNYNVSFGLPNDYIDVNPSNDTGTVTLQQDVPTVPAMGKVSLAILLFMMAVTAAVTLLRRRRAGLPNGSLRPNPPPRTFHH